jgi:hypothetical protein
MLVLDLCCAGSSLEYVFYDNLINVANEERSERIQ